MKSLLDKLLIMYSTFFFLGHIKRFAQSIASLITLSVFYFVQDYFPFNDDKSFLLLIIIASVIAIPAAGRAEIIYEQKDSRNIVIDDIIGALITVFGFSYLSPGLIAAGFVLFRVYDNTKIFPVNVMERLHGGFGVVMDDVVAGIMANISLRILVWIL